MKAIIQARMSSTRLPGKVMMKINDLPMIHYVINQTKAARLIDDVIIATTNDARDKKIVEYCIKNKIKYFRGSNEDVLDRYYKCAKKFKCNPVIRISSDSPLIDPTVIDRTIKKFMNNSYDYTSTNIKKKNGKWVNSACNFPQGMVVEVSTFKALEKAWKEAKKPSEREHVFPYVQFNPKLFKISNVENRVNLSSIRCTVDRKNDIIFVREIYSRISPKKKFVLIRDIRKIIRNVPDLVNINKNIKFDEGYRRSLLLDKKMISN